MQANPLFDTVPVDIAGLPLDDFFDHLHDDDDEILDEETASDHPSIGPVVSCHWYNCCKMFKAGTYLCIDAERFLDHMERDHLNLVYAESGPTIKCLWKFNHCLKEIERDDILAHVKDHFETDEDIRVAYSDANPIPKKWVYCLWKDCHDAFVDPDVEAVWKQHIWKHIRDDYIETDATTKILCEWEGCSDPKQEFMSRAMAQHVKKHLRDGMHDNYDHPSWADDSDDLERMDQAVTPSPASTPRAASFNERSSVVYHNRTYI